MNGQMGCACLTSAEARERSHGAGRNYWGAYLPELTDWLGVAAASLEAQECDAAALSRISVLICEAAGAGALSERLQGQLSRGVADGGTFVCVGGGSPGPALMELLGLEGIETRPQGDDDFAPAGKIALRAGPMTQGMMGDGSGRLLAFSDLYPARLRDAEAIADFVGEDGRPIGAAITARRMGKGCAFHFGFDLCKTLWVLRQGRPVYEDVDGDGILRSSDMVVIGGNPPDVLYGDLLLFLLRNMVAQAGVPMIHHMPPCDERGRPGGDLIPDALFFWGGDDEHVPGCQVYASDFMRGLGLPYHMNVMPLDGTFALSPQEARYIEQQNGHEIALHYNFIDGYVPVGSQPVPDSIPQPHRITFEEVAAQAQLFQRTFGKTSVCTVNHWTRWTGWTEVAEYKLRVGELADNSRVHHKSPPSNPTNIVAFSFGTAFPYWFWTDWRKGNQRLDFMQLPITAYECGYHYEGGAGFPVVRRAIDLAAHHHLTMNMFYHPCNTPKMPQQRAAIEEAARYIGERRIAACHMGCDEMARWWQARSKARVGDAETRGNGISFEVECEYAGGCVVMVPVARTSPPSPSPTGRGGLMAMVDGEEVPVRVREDFGQRWAFVPVAKGRHKVTVGRRS